MFQSLETRVVSASSSIKVRNSFFFAGVNNINCYASSCTSGLSKVAGCRQKLPPTWLVSAGYSAWHFFVSPHSLLYGMFRRKNETSLAVRSEERWLDLQVTEALSVNTIS